MSERDHQVSDALDQLLPLAVEDGEWERVLADARRERWRQRPLVVALAAGIVLTVGAALAATGLPWWEHADPPVNPSVVDRQLVQSDSFPPSADRSRARTVARANGAALVAAPVGKTGYCVIPSLPGSPDLGFSCVYQVRDAEGDGSEFRSYARPASAGEPRWIVYGRITDAAAAALDLTAAAGESLIVRLSEGGFFLADVPRTRWAVLNNQAGEARIVDSQGSALRAVCIQWGPSPFEEGAGDTRYPSPVDTQEEPGPCKARSLVFPRAVLAQAELKLEVPAEGGHVLRLFVSPSTTGGECKFTVVAAKGSPIRPDMMGGGSCSLNPTGEPTKQPPITIGVSKVRKGLSAVFSQLDGRVDPDLDVRRVMLEWATGSHELAFDGGYFLGANLFYNPPARDLPFFVVAYEAGGKEVARMKIPNGWLYIR